MALYDSSFNQPSPFAQFKSDAVGFQNDANAMQQPQQMNWGAPLSPSEMQDLKRRNGGLIPRRDDGQIKQFAQAIASGQFNEYQINKLMRNNPASAAIFAGAKNAYEKNQQFQTGIQQFFKDPSNPDFKGAATFAMQAGRMDIAKSLFEQAGKSSGDTSFMKEMKAAGIQPGSKEWNDKLRAHLSRMDAPTMMMGAENASLESDPETLKFMAAQALAGDASVFNRLGYGVQGSKNLLALRKEMTRQAKAQGMSAPELAAKMAEYQGTKAGERTLGVRTANVEMAGSEAYQMADLALEASSKLDRTQIKTMNDAYQAVQRGTQNPQLRTFVAANTSLINAYARAISPSGVPTVSDKDHAREMLSTAFSRGDYAATVNQMKREIEAARKAPGQVRQEFRNAMTGKQELPSTNQTTPNVVNWSDLK